MIRFSPSPKLILHYPMRSAVQDLNYNIQTIITLQYGQNGLLFYKE
jgi:hypothetical protein